MPRRSRRLSALVLLAPLALSCGVDAAPPPDLEVRLRGELERLAGVLESAAAVGLPEAVAAQVEPQRQALTAAREIAAAPLLLQRLGPVAVGVETLAFVAAHRDAGTDLARLEALWAERAPRFAGAPPSTAPRAATPPLVVALAAAAENRAEKLYRASLPYGRATQPLFGLYYLAEAEGELAYRDLVVRLAADVPGESAPPPARERVEAALAGLEAEMLAAFAADPGGRGMVPVSARLKEARELLEGGRLEAAALTLLEARLELGRRLSTAAAGAEATPVESGRGARQAARADEASGPSAETPAVPPGSLAAPYAALAVESPDAATREILRRDVLPLYRTLTAPRGDSR